MNEIAVTGQAVDTFVRVKKGYKYEIGALRTLAVIIIVFFHGFWMPMGEYMPENIRSVYWDLFHDFNVTWFINIAMPLFVVMSGYLFCSQMTKNRYAGFKDLCVNKFKRLWLPFLICSSGYMLLINDFNIKWLYRGAYWHLWFLPMLFWCFVFGWFLFRHLKGYKCAAILLVTFALSLSVVPNQVPALLGINAVKSWFFWFVFGMAVFVHENHIFSVIKKYRLVYALTLFYIAATWFYPMEYGHNSAIGIMASACAILALWYSFRQIEWQRLPVTGLILSVASASFGIYIIHGWLLDYMIRLVGTDTIPLLRFSAEYVYLFPILLSAAAFVISFAASRILLMTRAGRFLIG